MVITWNWSILICINNSSCKVWNYLFLLNYSTVYGFFITSFEVVSLTTLNNPFITVLREIKIEIELYDGLRIAHCTYNVYVAMYDITGKCTHTKHIELLYFLYIIYTMYVFCFIVFFFFSQFEILFAQVLFCFVLFLLYCGCAEGVLVSSHSPSLFAPLALVFIHISALFISYRSFFLSEIKLC